MKVAVIIDTWFPHIGGGQINAWEICKRLASKELQVDIITRNNGQDSLKLPKNLNVFKLGGESKLFDSLSKILFMAKAFLFLARRDYDIIHAHTFLPGITARFLSVTKGMPSALTIHGTSIGTSFNNIFKKWLEKFILCQILYSAQITVSRDFLKIKNINKKIHYIPNGVDISQFDKINVPKTKQPTLIFVGRLHPQKNLPVLLQCINTLKQEFPQIQLLIVGDGKEKAKLEKLIKNLNLHKNVKLTGEAKGTQLIKLYKSSHLFILPSIYEGQPLTLLEAWAAKLPVIVSKTGDCQYLIKNGVNGYLIEDPQDPKGVANSIIYAFKSKNLQRLGQNGYNFVKKNFSWEKSATQTLKLYGSLIKN